MGKLIKGDIVVINFVSSDCQKPKKRPALVLASSDSGDILLCQITSTHDYDNDFVFLTRGHFTSGSLPQDCYIMPGRLFTVPAEQILYTAGHIEDKKLQEAVFRIETILHT